VATKKYQVFVSSTFRDLVDERQDTIRNILDLNHIPAGMELFPAADVEQLTYIRKVIDECDYYLLIVGGRYGSMDEEGVSFTEREYDYAVETGKFVVAFVHGEPGDISVKNSDVKPKVAAALNTFRSKVMEGRLVREWTNRQDLQLAVLKSLMHAFSAYPQVGWIRGDQAASEQVLEQSNKALQENAELRDQVTRLLAAQKPKYENLAGLGDSVEVRYRTSYSTAYSPKLSYHDHRITLQLRDIFVRVAADLSTPKTELTISTALKAVIKDSPTGRDPHDVNQMDVAVIKAQFLALGLISTSIGTSVQGALHEYLSLTEKGTAAYMEAIVVRKPFG
jgi:hypothetical protein